MAAAGRHRLLQLPRGADKQFDADRVPIPVTNLWRRTLRQRSQKDWTTWERIKRLADDWLPKPRILRPWPESRFAVRHPRWEKLWGGRRRSWHLHRPYEPKEVVPWPKSMISAEA